MTTGDSRNTHKLEEDVADTSLDVDGRDGDKLDDESLSLLDGDVDLLSHLGLAKEEAGGED